MAKSKLVENPELQAMALIDSTLLGLPSEAARRRVLAWIDERHAPKVLDLSEPKDGDGEVIDPRD